MVFLLISIFYLLLSISKGRYIVSNSLRNDIIDGLKPSRTFYDMIAEDCLEGPESEWYSLNYDWTILAYTTYVTQDTVEENNNKKSVYFYNEFDSSGKAEAHANVLFAGFCWQIIRTTDTGGVKLLYNGVAVNNKCETTRSATKGVMAVGNGTTQNMSAASLYGRSYDYNLDTGQFTIKNSSGLPTVWNNSNYSSLIGTYTCLSNSNTCTTLYYVGSYKNSTTAYVAKYTIGDTQAYYQIGTSVYNAKGNSLTTIGYMFNKEYDYIYGNKSGEYFNTATWDSTNSVYVLSSGNGGTYPDSTHHYICDSDCTKVRYYYYISNYILLENGETVEDALYKMYGYGTAATKAKAINANYTLNKYDSAIKGYLENWYKKNLVNYSSYIDSGVIYCNERSIKDLNGWDPNGTTMDYELYLYHNHVKNYANMGNLICQNVTDRFSVENPNAKLSYPVGLITFPESELSQYEYLKTSNPYWHGTPYSLDSNGNAKMFMTNSYSYTDNDVNSSVGVRPVITLKYGVTVRGSGTYTNPFIVS